MGDTGHGATRVAEPPAGTHVILYDGICGLCNGFNRFVLRRDAAARFRFASLQSDFARRVLEPYGADPGDLDTVFVIAAYGTDTQELLSRSRAILFVLRGLRGPWRRASALGVLPGGLLELGYRLVARYRYRLFGRHASCPLPGPGERERFIEI